jgi:uroporphyrinogen-III synthase
LAHRKEERVLVTRSEPGASTLTAALLAAGIDAVVYPVLAIRPLDARTIERAVTALPKWSVAVFLSVHAVTHGLEPLLRTVDPRERTWLAIGRSTAQALEARGIDARFPEDERSEGILALPELADVKGRGIVIVAGRGGRDLIATTLGARGATVTLLPVYERAPADVRPAIDTTRVGAAVLSSAEGAAAFARLWKDVGDLRAVRVIVPSERVAEAARKLGFGNVIRSAGASNEAVVAALTAGRPQ